MSETLRWYRFAELPGELLYQALQFRQAVFVVEQASLYADLDGNDQRALQLVAAIDGDLAGYLRLVPWPSDAKVTIGRVAVAPAYRRRGLGRRMMTLAVGRARQEFPRWAVALSAQAYLVQFYESLGFAAVSAPYDDAGVPHIDMTLRWEVDPVQ